MTSAIEQARLRSWRARVFVATWLSYFGYYFCRKPWNIAKNDIGHACQFDSDKLGDIGAAYLIAYAAGQFLNGAIGPKLGARVMLLAGMALTIACGVALGFTENYHWFIVLMIINGFAQATGWSSNVGCMASWFTRGERGRVMGIWATCFQAGNAVAPALASWAMARWGFRYAFFSGSVALGVIWAIFVLNQRNHPEDVGLPPVRDPDEAPNNVPPDVAAAGPAARTKIQWPASVWISIFLIGGAYFGMKFIRYAIDSWGPFLLARNFGLKSADAGYLSISFGTAGIIGVVATGWLSDRFFDGRRALISFYMVLGVLASTLALVTVGSTTVVAFTLSQAAIGLTLYGPDALMTGAGAMDIGKGDGAIRAAGIISGIGSMGSVVQELVIGRMYKTSGGQLGPILFTLFGSAVLTAVCLGAIVWRNRRGTSDV